MTDEPESPNEMASRVVVRFLVTATRLVSRPIIWSFRVADRILDLEKREAAANQNSLIREVRLDCAEIFKTYGGRVVLELSEGSPSMDFAKVVVEVRSIQLRAFRDRGFTTWQISSPGSRYSWQPLDAVCRRFAPTGEGPYSTFRLLQDHLPQIESLFASESWIPPIGH